MQKNKGAATDLDYCTQFVRTLYDHNAKLTFDEIVNNSKRYVYAHVQEDKGTATAPDLN